MTRDEVYGEIQEMFGLVPTMFKAVPDRQLEHEWKLFKSVQIEPGPIPNKYRELIGLGISAVIKCRYCIFFHTMMAKLHGAADEEIEDALHYAKSSVGWSAYISGLQIDFEQFKREVEQACDYVRRQQATRSTETNRMAEMITEI